MRGTDRTCPGMRTEGGNKTQELWAPGFRSGLWVVALLRAPRPRWPLLSKVNRVSVHPRKSGLRDKKKGDKLWGTVKVILVTPAA